MDGSVVFPDVDVLKTSKVTISPARPRVLSEPPQVFAEGTSLAEPRLAERWLPASRRRRLARRQYPAGCRCRRGDASACARPTITSSHGRPACAHGGDNVTHGAAVVIWHEEVKCGSEMTSEVDAPESNN